jgi:hypothetical protein
MHDDGLAVENGSQRSHADTSVLMCSMRSITSQQSIHRDQIAREVDTRCGLTLHQAETQEDTTDASG